MCVHVHVCICMGSPFLISAKGLRTCHTEFIAQTLAVWPADYICKENSVHISSASISPIVSNLSGPVRDTPNIVQYPFEIVSQRGYRTHLALFSCGIAQVSLRYLLCVGASRLQFACYPRGKAQKGGGRGKTPSNQSDSQNLSK